MFHRQKKVTQVWNGLRVSKCILSKEFELLTQLTASVILACFCKLTDKLILFSKA